MANLFLLIFPISFFWGNSYNSTIKHPIHIGVTEINFNEKTSSVEVIHKIFIDDFELAIEEKYGVKLGLGSSQELEDKEEYIKKYAAQNFKINLDGKQFTAAHIGSEYDIEAIWIYQEIENIEKIKDLELNALFLFELFDDQKNIVHIKYKTQKKSFLFSDDSEPQSISFN